MTTVVGIIVKCNSRMIQNIWKQKTEQHYTQLKIKEFKLRHFLKNKYYEKLKKVK